VSLRTKRLPATALLAAALLLPAPACLGDETPGTLRLESCRIPGGGTAHCAVFPVPEDRRVQGGRTLDLNLVVLPARRRSKQPDPIFFLHGGPGSGAAGLAGLFRSSPWREDRDIVLLDQRGTGQSAPLDCPIQTVEDIVAEMATFRIPGVEECRRRQTADLSRFTTSIAVEDLEALRKALGVPQVNLIGGSYGTRVALEYVRRYPDSVRTATLRGVAPPSFSLPSEFDGDSLQALEHVLADCKEDARCRQAFPDIRRELDQVVRRLEQEPGSARIRIEGETHTVQVTRDLFVASLHYTLYLAGSASQIPLFIHQAHGEDYDALVGSSVRFSMALMPQLSMGAFLSVACAEDAPFYDAGEVVAGARETLLRGRFSLGLQEACKHWPVDPVPAEFKQPVRSAVPVLLLSGEADPVTPARVAEKAAQHLAGSLHVVLPEMGHSDLTPGCVDDLVGRFLAGGTVEGLDVSCARSLRRPAFELP
jgi:pimeloyl-ACP methyl ester carboxylesterase